MIPSLIEAIVVGADSRIGSVLLHDLRADGLSAAGTSRRFPISPERQREGILPYDLERASSLALPQCSTAYICAAMTGFRQCEEDPERAKRINVDGTTIAADNLLRRGAKVVVLSSAAAETHPGSVYGKTKLECERGVLALNSERVACVRFGPVAFVGRKVQANGPYNPISLNALIFELLDLSISFVPGVHRILSNQKHMLQREKQG